MKVRIKVRPNGYVSFGGGPLSAWPKVGAVVDLPEDIAEDLIKAGNAEKAQGAAKAVPLAGQVETRPAVNADEERRPAGRPSAKKADAASA